MVKRCCFLGQREISKTEGLENRLREEIERMITEENVQEFLFGSKSAFNSLCHELVTEIKERYPFIKRFYIRAEYPVIEDSYKAFLLENYEETFYPKALLGATKSVYVKRNREMIDGSDFCIIYCADEYCPKGRKSGSKLALDYAVKRGKKIYRFP